MATAARRRLQGRVNAAEQQLDALLQLKLAPANHAGDMLSDEEYLAGKSEPRKEQATLEEQLQAVQGQGTAWVDDCERFFTLHPAPWWRASRGGPSRTGRRCCLQICSNLTLTGQTVGSGLPRTLRIARERAICRRGWRFPVRTAGCGFPERRNPELGQLAAPADRHPNLQPPASACGSSPPRRADPIA